MKLSYQKNMVLILLLLAHFQVNAMGFGDWSEKTKNGTEFSDPGGGVTIILPDKSTYQYPSSWYFYQDHIIGTRTSRELSRDDRTTTYFIIDEIENIISEFDEENSWKEYISENDLAPILWTRWHSDNWNHMNVILLWMVLLSPVILTLLVVELLYRLFRKREKRIKTNNKQKAFLMILPISLLLVYLFGQFPGSI